MSHASTAAPLSMRIRVAYPNQDAFVHEYWPNISSGGVFIQTKTPQPVGTRLLFQVVLEDGSPLLHGRVRVSWVKDFDPQKPDRPHGMGLRFIELDETSQALIDRVVAYRDEMRGASGASIRSKTVELQTLAEEVHSAPGPQPPIEVHTEELAMPVPTDGNGQGSSGLALDRTNELLDRAEAQLQQLLANTQVDKAKIEAAETWAREGRSLEGDSQNKGNGDKGNGDKGNGAAPQPQGSGSTVAALDTPEALAALERLLNLPTVPPVKPLNTRAPEPRAVTVPRPELASIEAYARPLDDQTVAHEVAGLEGALGDHPLGLDDQASLAAEPLREATPTPREDTATVSKRIQWPPPGGAPAGHTPPTEAQDQPAPMEASSTETGEPEAVEAEPEAEPQGGLPDSLTEQAYADALLTSAGNPMEGERTAVGASFDLSEPDDPATPCPTLAEAAMLSATWPDTQPETPRDQPLGDPSDGAPEESTESSPDLRNSAALDDPPESPQTRPADGLPRDETHVELDLNDLEFLEVNLAGPDDGSSDTQQELQAIEALADTTPETDSPESEETTSTTPAPTAEPATASPEDDPTTSPKRKKKGRSGLFKRLLGKDE